MPSMSTTYSFTNGSVIDAIQVNTNFNDIKTSYNTNAVQIDGTVQATTASLGDGIVTSAKIANDTIVNADINSAAGIVDTKLATIATALKVSNSATTATNANTASAIVARDASGNFSAGTITATLSGNATTSSSTTGASASCSGNSATATALQTARLIGGISFNGTANISLPGVNATGNQNTSGQAGSLSGFGRGTVVTTFTNVTAGGKNRMLTSFPHGLGSQPSGAAVYNGDHAAMVGLFHVYSVDATNITVEASEYNNTFISIVGRIYWMAYA